jgi:hypothetical protein
VVGTVPAQSQIFQTGRISICTNKIKTIADACAELPGPFDSLDRRVLPNKRIDFKLVIMGRQQALAYLQDYGHLPVKVGVWRDGIRREDDISIDIGQNDWDVNQEKLTNQATEEGQFTWRTFFNVKVNNAKSISIEINDGLNVTALSGESPARLSFAFAN